MRIGFGGQGRGRTMGCSVFGCDQPSDLWGTCAGHRHIPIKREFDRALERGAATTTPPPCFPDPEHWVEYVALWSLVERISSRYSQHVEYCRDCTPAYRDTMQAQDKCGHPETIFVRKKGELRGISSHFGERWQGALLGFHGQLEDIPDDMTLAQTAARLSRKQPRRPSGKRRLNP
jgi:hypothetical protein